MSIKIYYAYRIPIRRLNEFIDLTRQQGYKLAAPIVKNLMKAVSQKYVDKVKSKPFTLTEEQIRFGRVINLIKDWDIHNVSGLRAPGVDIDFSLNIWLDKRYAYIIPCSEDYIRGNLKYPKWVEDFHYQNSCDRPTRISAREWNKRIKKWNLLNCGTGVSGWNSRRIQHSIIDFSKNLGDYDAEQGLSEVILGDSHAGFGGCLATRGDKITEADR